MRRFLAAAIVTAAAAVWCAVPAWAGYWYEKDNQYVYYEGTPGNPGNERAGVEIRVSGNDRSRYELRINGETVRNTWLGVKRLSDNAMYWVYFDEKGQDFGGWKQIDGNWYYFEGGGIIYGWHRINQEYYYLDPVTGIMQTSGTAMRDGRTYEFSSDGRSVAIDGLKNAEEGGTEGWIEENGNWYYLRDGVKVTNEWLYNGDEKYYVGADGARYTGWREVDGAFYDFDRKGRAAHDVVQYRDEHKYSLGSDGRATELPITPEEKMIYSDTTEWCEDTYLIYTLSQEKAETAARLKRVQPPSAQELLKRDWGISTKEECEAMIQSLVEAGKAESTQAGKAWDFSRAMLLCRMMQLTGWIDLEERIDRQIEIAPVIQSSFSSWSEFNDAYMEGFRAWNTDAAVGEYREAAYQIVKRAEAYYCNADWNRELKRTW